MTYTIIARSQRTGEFILRLGDGRIVRDHLAWVGFHPKVGDAGTIITDERGRNKMKVAALDGD